MKLFNKKLSTLFAGVTLMALVGCSDDSPVGPQQDDVTTAVPSATMTTSATTSTMARPDLTPWQDPSGYNQGSEPDLTFDGPVQDGAPVTISVDVFNRGSDALDTAVEPLVIQLRGNGTGSITTDADVTGDVKTLDDGTVIQSGESVTVDYTWTPDAAKNTTRLILSVDPFGEVAESVENNNATLRNVTIAPAPSVPTFGCEFESPLNGRKTLVASGNRTIPVKVRLSDENGQAITDSTLPGNDNPVLSVVFNDTGAETNLGRFRFADGKWMNKLSVKGLDKGAYTIKVKSGNDNDYKTAPVPCQVDFTRK